MSAGSAAKLKELSEKVYLHRATSIQMLGEALPSIDVPVNNGAVSSTLNPRLRAESDVNVNYVELDHVRGESMVETKITPMGSDLDSMLQRCLTVLLLAFRMFGFHTERYRMGNTLRHWRRLCDEVGGANAWIKVSKYKLAAYFAFHNDQPLPVPPFSKEDDQPGVLLGGRAVRWQRRILNSVRSREFLTTILYSKKGFPRPDRAAVAEAEKDMVKKLTTPRPTPPYLRLRDWADEPIMNRHQEFYVTKDVVKRELRRTVRELFEGKEYTIEDRVRPFCPSTSANYINSRRALGAIGTILEHEDLLENLRTDRPLIRFEKVRRGDGEERRVQEADSTEYSVNDSQLMRNFRRFYWRLLARAEGEVPTVAPVGLPEALKVRVISKGPGLLMTVFKPLQQFLWRVLKDHPTFILTGTEVTAEIVQKSLGEKLRDGELYLSGDYADATNELHSWVSETIAEELSSVLRLSKAEQRMFRRALTGHVFKDAEGNFKLQETGQLMGSVVSFPILCIANAACTRYALEQAVGKVSSLRNCPMLINGDDVVARTTKLGCSIWRTVTSYAGLKESVGKTYYSRDFLNVNSTNFRRLATPEVRRMDIQKRLAELRAGIHPSGELEGERPMWFVRVPYVNMGLLLGLKRSGLRNGIRDAVPGMSRTLTLGACQRELASSCPPSMVDTVLTEYTHRNWDVLSQLRVPWFMPEYLGGLGFQPYTNVHTGELLGPTFLDLRKGSYLYWNAADKVRRGTMAEWQLHYLAMERMPERPSATIAENENFDRVYGRMVVSLLFDSRIELKHLKKMPSGPYNQIRNLRCNERLWVRAERVPLERALAVRDRLISARQPPRSLNVVQLISS